jgi:hypothetical protein
VSTSSGTRVRAALVSLAAAGLALAAASPALADSGAPVTPTGLMSGYQACATDASAPLYYNTGNFNAGGTGLPIEGIASDTDATGTALTIEFQLWPVADPADVSSWSLSAVPDEEAVFPAPSSDFTDGQTYAWDAASVADGATSAWSAPCYVAVDNTRPASPPTVTSANYPSTGQDQGGAPVQITLGANGVSDVVGYVFSWVESLPIPDWGSTPPDPDTAPAGSARAPTLGGSVSLNLIPPNGSGPMTLTVASVDRAGNESAQTTYGFMVADGTPTVTLQDKLPSYGTASIYDLSPNAAIEARSPVVSYQVQVSGDPSGQQNYTVAAKKNGTAQTQITLDSTFGEWVQVSSVSADGWVSDLGSYSIITTPTITSDVYTEGGTSGGVGVTSTFTFAPPVKDVASYSYSFDYGTTQTIVKAHDGTARLSWTPTASGSYDIEVYAILKNGAELYPYDYFFNVN